MTVTRPPAIDFRSFEPYYLQLKRILVKEMEDNGAEGSLLPSEAELCSRYSVSRTVVRQALAELENDGLVLKVKGKGTFVTGHKLDTSFIQDKLGFYESMTRAGHVVQSRILKLPLSPRPSTWPGCSRSGSARRSLGSTGCAASTAVPSRSSGRSCRLGCSRSWSTSI